MGNEICYVPVQSRAQDNALRALRDVAQVLADQEYVVIGGLMVTLLAARYPASAIDARATQDADIGITTVVAESAVVHSSLLRLNYIDVNGNTYVMQGEESREVNVLVPAQEHYSQRGTVEIAGRGFDAAPGLKLALLANPEQVTVCALFLDGTEEKFQVKVPSVMGALVLKLCVRERRSETRDLHDIQQLLQIRHEYQEELSPTWSLGQPQRGERGDAQRSAQKIRGLTPLHYSDIQRLKMLLQQYVSNPE